MMMMLAVIDPVEIEQIEVREDAAKQPRADESRQRTGVRDHAVRQTLRDQISGGQMFR
jgi:hypothetical protein